MPLHTPTGSRPARRPGLERRAARRLAICAAVAVSAAAAVSTGTCVAAAAAPAVPSAAVPASAALPNTLAVGARMTRGAVLRAGTTRLVMQTDGNLVLYSGPGIGLWSSHTSRIPGAWASVKRNGQLVVRTPANRIVYASPVRLGTAPRIVIGDGEMVLRTSNRTAWTTGTAVKGYAISRLPGYRWSAAQWPCLNRLWERESGWNPRADNPSSSAYGIPQALPGSKMASAGADWRTNHRTQIAWGLGYIDERYGSPCGAWSHSQRYGWYAVPGQTVLSD